MGQKRQVLVDTDILIKVFRGNSEHKAALESEKENLCISSITYLELLHGLKTRRRIIDLHKQMNAYRLLHVSETISMKAIDILNKYTASNSIRPADGLIAATALVHQLLLYTDNKQDFDFIKEIRFFS